MSSSLVVQQLTQRIAHSGEITLSDRRLLLNLFYDAQLSDQDKVPVHLLLQEACYGKFRINTL
jgi:hypothetical protein